MSIRFVSDGSTIANTAPLPGIAGTMVLTISFWLWWDVYADNNQIALEYTRFTDNYFVNRGFTINPNESSTGGFVVGAGSLAGASYSYFTRPSAQEWHHYVICFDRANTNGASAVYVDGVLQSLTNGFTDPNVASDGFEAGGDYYLYFLSRRNIDLFGAGKLAEVSVFPAITLSAEEAVALYRGVSPLDLRQDIVPYYFPLDGDDTIIRRQIGNQVSAGVDNLSAVILDEHPPIALDFDDWNASFVSVLEIGGGGSGEGVFSSNLSSYMRSGIFEHIFRQDQFAKPNLWLALCSQAPAATGNSNSINEIPFGSGYSRINMTGNSIWSTPQKVDNQYQVYNAQEVTFGPSQSNWGWVSGWAIVDGSGSSSNLIILGDGISKYVFGDDMVKFPTGSIYIKMGGVL